MTYAYTREPGDEGQILTDGGGSEGKALSSLLDNGPIPIKAGLELVSYVADILTIAEEDGVFHGDLKPGSVRVDSSGAISVDGYGVERRSGRAPEGRPVGVSSDTYGMGVVLHAVLSGDALGAVPRDRDGHDDVIVERLLRIDWQDLTGKRWMNDVLSFLASMLAFEPEERPEPLDVANVLGQVSSHAQGQGLVDWASQVVGGATGGRRRRVENAEPEPELAGPQALGGPVTQTSAYSLRKAASAKGECTAFWSREKIAAMLEEDDENASCEDLAPPDPVNAAPLPPSEPAPQPRPAPAAPPAPAPQHRATPPPQPAPHSAQGASPPAHQAPSMGIQGPVAGVTEAPGPSPVPMVIGVIVVVMVLCGGVGLLGSGFYFWGESNTQADMEREQVIAQQEQSRAEAEAEQVEREAQAEQQAEADEAAELSAKQAEEEAKKERARKERKEAKKEAEKDAQKDEAVAASEKENDGSEESAESESKSRFDAWGIFPAYIKVSVPNHTVTIKCGDGQKREFVGSTTLQIEDVTTCLLDVEGARGVIVAKGARTFQCAVSGNRVNCS